MRPLLACVYARVYVMSVCVCVCESCALRNLLPPLISAVQKVIIIRHRWLLEAAEARRRSAELNNRVMKARKTLDERCIKQLRETIAAFDGVVWGACRWALCVCVVSVLGVSLLCKVCAWVCLYLSHISNYEKISLYDCVSTCIHTHAHTHAHICV